MRLIVLFFRSLRTLNLPAVLVAALLAVPILSLAFSLFAPDEGAWAHVASTVLGELLTHSFLLLVMVGLGVALVGTATAWVTARYDFPGRRAFEWLLILPLAMPAYVMAYAYTDLLQYAGPVQTALRDYFGWQGKGDYGFPEIRSLGGAATMLVFALYPYVYVLARVAFLEQPASLIEAGRTFGYRAVPLFFRVSLPLARPAIAAGVALVGMETLADYGTVSYFGVNTFTTGIFNTWFSLGDRISAAKLSMMLIGFIGVLLLLEQQARQRARYYQTPGRYAETRRLAGVSRLLAIAVCGLPLLVGFVLPVLLLIRLALADGGATLGTPFIRLAAHSLGLALFTAGLAVALAFWFGYTARRSPNALNRGINRLIGLGYAIPGTVIAVGVLIPIIRLDHLLADFLQDALGISTGLILTGSLIALVYAYLIRFLAVALQSVESGLIKITPNMDDAARSLGLRSRSIMRQIHLPLLRSSLITAGLLVFVDVMKELPATLVMRPFNFDTLAVQAYNLAKDERLAEASVASLAIVAVGLIPVLVASREITRYRRGATLH